MPDRIEVEGLNELRAALKMLGDVETSKEFKQAGYHVAAEIVTPKAKARAGGLGAMFAKAAATIKPSKIATGAAIRFGAGFVGAMGSEFGAGQNVMRNTRRGPMHGWNQFRPWKGSGGDAGYFLWPTIRAEADTIADTYDRLLEPFYARLFPEGR